MNLNINFLESSENPLHKVCLFKDRLRVLYIYNQTITKFIQDCQYAVFFPRVSRWFNVILGVAGYFWDEQASGPRHFILSLANCCHFSCLWYQHWASLFLIKWADNIADCLITSSLKKTKEGTKTDKHLHFVFLVRHFSRGELRSPPALHYRAGGEAECGFRLAQTQPEGFSNLPPATLYLQN